MFSHLTTQARQINPDLAHNHVPVTSNASVLVPEGSCLRWIIASSSTQPMQTGIKADVVSAQRALQAEAQQRHNSRQPGRVVSWRPWHRRPSSAVRSR